MPDVLDATGLTLKSLTEIVDELEAGMVAIYGSDINVAPDTPDGQLIALFAQACIDLREVIQDVYTSFDPDQAQGSTLDQRVSINKITRNGGTFTITPVNITVDRSVSLVGLDTESESINIPAGVFTIRDDTGTLFVLVDSETLTTGTHVASFRAAELGNVIVSPNTLTTAVTAIAGVTAINNPASVTTQGADEESDAALRVRRAKSVAVSSVGYIDSVESNLLTIDGVTACIVDENFTDTTDAKGTAPHTMWAIVEGGTDADIAAMIYAKKSAGCGMRGSEDVVIERSNGLSYTVYFDRPGTENLYARFDIEIIGGGVIDETAMKTEIVANVLFDIGEDASTDEIVCYLKGSNSRYRITSMEISKNGTLWTEVATLSSIQNKFVLSTDRITINA